MRSRAVSIIIDSQKITMARLRKNINSMHGKISRLVAKNEKLNSEKNELILKRRSLSANIKTLKYRNNNMLDMLRMAKCPECDGSYVDCKWCIDRDKLIKL